jgi:hypothetical protein
MKGMMFSLNLPEKIANGQKTVTRRNLKDGKATAEKGDLLYVKEKWKPIGWDYYGSNWTIQYSGGSTQKVEHLFDDPEKENDFWLGISNELHGINVESDSDGNFILDEQTIERFKWRNVLFMPKNAARTILKVTETRIERLHEITESDAKREGVDIVNPRDFGIHDENRIIYRNYLNRSKYCTLAKQSFRTLWISLHGEESWNENPYICVIDFIKIDKK